MSLEQYKLLAEQEKVEVPTRFPYSAIFKLKTIAQVLFFNKHTQLEQLLLKDTTTFTSSIISSHSSIQKIPEYGDIYNVIIPHPFKTQLDNATISGTMISEIDQIVNEAPVIVFIHGLGGNLHQFDEQIMKFKGLTDIVAFDLPGSGFSTYDSKNFQLTLDNFSQFVIKFLNEKNFTKRDLIIVGHSYGTQIALKLVNLLPSQIKGVVLLAPPKIPFKRSWIQTTALRIFRSIPILFDVFRKFDRLNNIESVSLKRLFGDKEIDDYYKFKQFKFNLSTVSHNFLTHALEWDPISVEEVLEASNILKGKLLIIDGDEDKVTHKGGASYKDFLGSSVEYVVLPKAGHNLTLDSFTAVNELLGAFFKKADPTVDEKLIDELRAKFISY